MKIKRGIWIFVIMLVLLSQINLINSQSPSCCFHPNNFCQNVYSPQECCGEETCEEAIYNPTNPCSETQCEWEGCCIQTCEKTLFKDCNYAFTFLEYLAPTYDCNSEPQCGQGCCVYLTSQGTIGECELTTQASCTIGGIYTDAQFQLGLSESECNQICEINQTMVGSLAGTVTDNTTLLSIRDVQIYVEGISTFTEINGEYFLPEIPIGTVVVEAYSQGYASFTTSVEINNQQITNLSISLIPSTENVGTLTGYITNSTSLPVLAYIYWEQEGVYTNPQGKYTLTNILQGNQKITILADNYLPKIEYVNISPTLNEKDFQLEKATPDETCGNNQLEQTEQCDPSSNQQGDCSPESCNQDCTCPSSCSELGGTCFNWEYQCQGNLIALPDIELCTAYNYQESSYGCCDEQIIEIPPCINGAINNEPISATDPSNGEMCECNSQFFPITDLGYCCDDIYHQPGNTCEFYGAFTGYITDENNNPLNGVTIEYTNLNESSTYSTSTSETGFYYLELPAGEYSLLATKETYSYFTDLTTILPSEEKQQNITLTSLYSDCSQENISAPILYVNHTRGIKDLIFTWEHSCPDYVDTYVLYRDENPIQTFENTLITYTDSEIDWDTTYTYYLIANSKYQTTSQSNIINVYTGDENCQDKTADESWCISTNRVVCDQFNAPVLWDGELRGSPNGDCTIAAGEGSVCQYKDDESWCTQPTECTAIESGNIFGLYFTKDLCHGINQQNYCYYDAFQGNFWTTINSCFNCEPQMTCFDYKTQYACEKDNCYSATENNECEWYSDNKFFKLLGKGICHPQDYSGTDKCSLCSPENNIFENTQCTAQTCSALGNCFSNVNESACITCDKTITCESYSTEQECIGETEFKVNKARCNSGYELTYSQDSCNLGRCAWENNQCIKDGNEDGQEDCNDNQVCLLDNTAPHTIITNLPPFINYLGTTLTFSIQDTNGANETYYCLGEDCCPKTEINQTTLFLDYTHNKLQNKQEITTINYYSIDNFQNVEQINSQQVYIDTILPNPEIEYSLEDSPNSEFTSNLYIITTPNEDMLCTDSLSYSNQTYLHNKFINQQTTLNYTELQDGAYLYSLDCTDLYQNNYKKQWEILVDRIHMITDETPHLQTKSQNDLIMSIKTVGDEFYCYYTREGEPYTHPFNPDQGGLGIQQEMDYYYQSILQNLSSETYHYKIECFEEPMQNLMDSAFLSFTIDNFPPQTEVLAIAQNGEYSELQQTPYSLLNFKLNCTDQKQGPPDEAGCNASYYCFTQDQNCTPDQQYTTPVTFSEESGTYNLCYYSTDSLNNIEPVKCNPVIFDTTPPQLQITEPIQGQIIYNKTYLVQGTYQDISQTDIFIKTKNQYSILSESINASTTFTQGQGTFSAEIPFFDGYNELIVTAYDNVGNTISISQIVYLDTIPPIINSLEITDSYQTNNPDSDNSLEYGFNLNFLLDANDEFYSDPDNEILSDITNIDLIIICKPNTGCINENIFVKMQPGQEYYEYNYNILENPLLPGQYTAAILAEDQFGNQATYQQSFEIKETSQTILKIYNHLEERIDNTNKNAEKTFPISFELESEKIDFIENLTITVTHTIPTLYYSEFEIQKINNQFNYILDEELYIGDYNVHYKILDKFGRTTYLTNKFTVEDTIPPTFNITIYKNQQITETVTYGIYDVLIESNENLLKITQLRYSFDGKTDVVHDIDGDYTTWWGKLYIPPTEDYIAQENTEATFEISAQDLSELTGTEIIHGKTFTIHTIDTTPQQIIPPINDLLEISDDYSFDYQWVKSSQTVTFNATPLENLAQFNYCFVTTCYPLIDGSIFEQPSKLDFTQDQKTTVSYQAIAQNGDTTAIKFFKLMLDKTSPELEIATSPNSIQQEIPVSAFYKDHYNIQKITFTGDIVPFEYIPGKRWGISTQTITLSQGDGNKTIIATAYDSAGNQKTATTITNLNLYAPPLTIEHVGNAIKTEEYYVSSSEYLEINGSYLFEGEVIIYPKSNKEHIAEANDGKFSIIINALDGYTGQSGYEVTNNITLVIEDYYNNKYETSIIVIKNLKEGAITIENPKTLFTNDQTPLIELLTSQHSQCTLEYWITEDNYRITEMESNNFLTHSVQIEDIFEPNAEILMNTNCTELSGKNNQKNFTITIDQINPFIYNLDVSLAELIEGSTLYYSYLLFTSNTTYFSVSASEPVRCKYGTTQDYNQMNKFPNFDNLEFGGQRISETLELQDNYYTYYLNCEDRAANLANFVTLDLNVNTHLPIQILDVEPIDYTNQKNPELIFNTYRDADCIINSIPEQGEFISQIWGEEDSKYKTTNAKTKTEHLYSNYQHTSTISAKTDNPSETQELQENQTYRFTIYCEGKEENIEPSELYSFEFLTDFTPPYIDLIEPNNGLITNQSIIPILGTTEQNANYDIYVDNQQQTFPLTAINGEINSFAVISEGYNTVKIEATDKATNKDTKEIVIIYNNPGDNLELINPLDRDIINPFNQISIKVLPKEENQPELQLTEFNIFKVNQTETIHTPSHQILTTPSDNIAILKLTNNLETGKYRLSITPINQNEIQGESENLLFEIKENLPEIYLSAPYSKYPYKYLVINTPNTEFKGTIDSDNFLSASIHTNELLKSTFNQKSFSQLILLDQGLNNFKILAENLDGEIAVRHGELTLDSNGPQAIISIE